MTETQLLQLLKLTQRHSLVGIEPQRSLPPSKSVPFVQSPDQLQTVKIPLFLGRLRALSPLASRAPSSSGVFGAISSALGAWRALFLWRFWRPLLWCLRAPSSSGVSGALSLASRAPSSSGVSGAISSFGSFDCPLFLWRLWLERVSGSAGKEKRKQCGLDIRELGRSERRTGWQEIAD